MDQLAWSIQQRMKFIEFSVFWEDEISRPKLVAQFDISPQQATKDLNRYQELVPKNIAYNPKRRRYVPTEKFKPKYIEGSAPEYLRHIDALRLEHKSENEIWIETVPSYDCTHLPVRFVDPKILKSMLNAIRLKHSVEIEYVSLSGSDGGIRRITPHSICTDGNRWHVRAYNHDGDRHSDYSLSRISKAGNISEAEKDIPSDKVWNTYVDIQVAPEDGLDETIAERLQIEYDMEGGYRSFSVRKAMLWYILRRLGFNPVATDKSTLPHKMRNESSFRLKLHNFDDVENWLERRQ